METMTQIRQENSFFGMGENDPWPMEDILNLWYCLLWLLHKTKFGKVSGVKISVPAHSHLKFELSLKKENFEFWSQKSELTGLKGRKSSRLWWGDMAKNLCHQFFNDLSSSWEIIQSSSRPRYLSTISLKNSHLFKIAESVITFCLKKISNLAILNKWEFFSGMVYHVTYPP